jgi:oligopeptide/dipeptide ABC transporter ATP-binding protein
MSIVLITHDLAVVAKMADEVAVMYAGQIVESGSVDDIFYKSSHPYTLGLKNAMPTNTGDRDKQLMPIEGSPPDLFSPPTGCGYFARCPYAMRLCEENQPDDFVLDSDQAHRSRCWLQHTQAPVIEVLNQKQLSTSHAD